MSVDRRHHSHFQGWRLCALSLALWLWPGQIRAADPIEAPEYDRVEWIDGSKLRGKVQSLDGQGHLVLGYPDAKEPLNLRTRSLSSIELAGRTSTNALVQSTARMMFVNGDEVPGRLTGFDGETFEFESWLGQKVKPARSTVKSISFFHSGLVVVYEGPTGMDGWKLGPGQRAWSYKDRAFHANGAGMIGRAVKLPKRSSVQFDLEWSNNLALMVGLYTDSIDRLDYNANSYLLYIATGVVSLQRIQRGIGANHLGQVEVPAMLEQNRVSLEIRADQNQGNVVLFANGVLVQRWQDQGGFSADGSGITFYAQLNESSLKLSNVRITEWDGNLDGDGAGGSTQGADIARLANRDRLVGALDSLSDGKATFKTANGSLSLPLKRINQILLNSPPAPPYSDPSGMIRFQFNSGARLSMLVSSWKDQQIRARSPQFGEFLFDLATVRKMNFNLDRVRSEASTADTDVDPLLQNE